MSTVTTQRKGLHLTQALFSRAFAWFWLGQTISTLGDGAFTMALAVAVYQLTGCLKAYYPVALDLFAKLQQRSSLLFLQTYPTLQAAQTASTEQIRQVLKSAGHTTASKVAPHIFEQLHQPRLRTNAVTVRTKSRLALALIAQLLPLVEQIAAYDKEIQQLFLSHEDWEHAFFRPRRLRGLKPLRFP